MSPCVSFGIPVRNGIGHIEKLIHSILNQRLSDLEIVVADNVSSDGTQEYLRTISGKDARIRCFYNKHNIGILENSNRVFELSQGEYFRLIGADDWLEPSFSSECVSLMENHPEIIGVTTNTVMHYSDGVIRCTKYKGERLESKDASRRFAQLMWLLSKGLLYYSPLSALYRRSAFEKTRRFQIVPDSDLVLVAEISFLGPFGHISKNLVHRGRPSETPMERYAVAKRLSPGRWKEVRHSYWSSTVTITKMIFRKKLTWSQKIKCWIALAGFGLVNVPREVGRTLKLLMILMLPDGHKLKGFLNRSKP